MKAILLVAHQNDQIIWGQIMEGEHHADGDDELLSAALEDSSFRFRKKFGA